MIHNIYTSSARQNPWKDPKQGVAWHFLHFPQNQTLPFKPPSLWSLPSRNHSLFHSPKTFLGLLRHALFPREFVASQINLPAWDTIHNPGMSMSIRSSFVSLEAHWLHKLCIGLWPLVEVHIGGTDRNTWVTCVVDTVWYANWGHVLVEWGSEFWVWGINWDNA